MANNTGLQFNPLAGLGGWNQQQSVPTTVDEYFAPQATQLAIPEWKPEQLQKAQDFVGWSINTSDEEKERLLDPFRELNKWNQGLRGLNRDELDLWERENAEKTEGQLEDWKERLWKNQLFARDLGLETFQAVPDADERDKMYENYLLGKPIIQRYGNNDNIQQLLSLTPEGKKELLQSSYKSDFEMKQDNKQAEDKDWLDYSLGERWNAITSDATRMGEEGMFVGGVVGGIAGGGLGTIPGMAIGGAAGMFGGLLTAISHPEDAAGINAVQRKAENDEILNKITVADNERKKAESQDDINERWANYMQAYNNGQISSADVDKMWDNLALNSKKEVTDELGNTHIEDYSGSNYYSAFKDEDEFEHFGTTDKLRYIAQSEVLAQKYGQGSALSILDQDMQNYVNDNQTGWTWAGNTLKNVWVGGVANLANNVTALGALSSYLTYGALHKVNDSYPTGEEALANYLNGKDASGNGEENWFSPQYWNKVDQYNTFDTDAIAKADKNGGISIYNNVVTPGTEGDFWSWNTLNEAVRMNKFAWSDLLKNLALAKVVRGATRLAGGVELAPGVLASESTAAAQAINKVGSMGVMAASSLGIDAAYGMQTYNDVLEQNNQRLDKIIDKDTDTIVKERLESPQARMEFESFVNAENEKRQRRAGERGKWIPVDEDQAWQDYTEHIRRQVREEQEALHAQDRQEAMNDAANAFAIDATIEGVRMATTNGMFKSYLFDKGTLNALKANNPYVGTTFKNGAYTLAKDATKKKALGVLGMNIWGGFQSNYFDDITVGYAKGFGIQDYNNFLLQKYNPAAYGSIMDDYVNPYIAGMLGAANASEEKRSFLDGTIGALGSVFTAMPNVGGMMSHRERMKQASEAAEKEGKKGNPLSGWEIASDFLNNPVIQAIADAKASTRLTEAEIKRANDIIKDHGYSFDNMVEAATALNQKAITREGTSMMEAEDAKDREAFTLATSLLALKNNGAVLNAQAEPEKANWSKKKRAANAIGSALNSIMGVQVFDEASSPYTRAMQALEDATTIDEIPVYIAQDNQITAEDNEEMQKTKRQSQLVQTFLGLDANKNALQGMSEEEKVSFAQERLKKNASNLLDMMQRTEEIQQKFEKSLGANMNPDLKQQLMYQYALDSRWKNRLNELEQQITGEENPIRSRSQENSVMAKYGSYGGYDRVKAAQVKRVEDARNFAEKATQDAKKENDPKLSIAENARLKAFRLFQKRSADENLKKEQAALKKIEADGDALNSALESGVPVVLAQDILKLNADERLRMLDDYYRNDYSDAQQQEIDKAKNMLMEDGTPINQAMERVRDAAVLNHRIEDNMEVARKIMQNPVEAQQMQRALQENRRRAILDYFNDKIVFDAFMDFAKDPESTLSEENVAKKVSDYSTALLNGMQKMAQKELKAAHRYNDMSDLTLDNIVKGIDAVLKERNQKLKETANLDSFLRKTKKVSHTEVQPVMIQLNDNQAVPSTMSEQVTTEREITPNDRKLMNYAMDYIAERGLPVEQMADEVTKEGFNEYLTERNHQLTVEDRANPVSPEYMQSLVNDVVGAFKANKDAVAVNNAEKKTTDSPVSVATKPVETKGEKPKTGEREEEARPDEVDPSDPFGLKKKKTAAPTEISTSKTEEKPVTPETSAEKKEVVAKSNRNQEILETASTLNSGIMEDVNVLLDEVDKMSMEDKTKEALKDIIQAQLSSRSFQNIQQLQGAVMADAMMTNQAEAPQIVAKATALSGINIANIKEKAAPASTTAEDNNNPTSPLTTPAPMEMSTMDLDLFIDNPRYAPQSSYIKNHNIVSFMQRLYDFWRGDYEKAHKAQVVFIYDDALASEVRSKMEQDGNYIANQAAPVIMAMEITDANKHLIEDQNQLIYIKDVPDEHSHYYQPLGFMPANDNRHMPSTADKMAAIRNQISFEAGRIKEPQIIRYDSSRGKKGKGGPIQTGILTMQSHTDEESIPHGTKNTPISDVQQLMENNALTPAESIVSSTEEERRAYEDAKQKNDGKALRVTSLYKKLRDAFISRIFKSERQAQNPDDPNAKEINFRVQKGSNDTYPKIVLTKKISETLDKNSGRPIVDLLREVDDSGDNAKEVIESNSRIKRLFNSLSKLSLSKGLFNADGSIANQTMFRSKVAEFEGSVKSAIKNNFEVDKLSVKVEVGEGRPAEKVVSINIYSGNPSAENLLSTLTTSYAGQVSEAEFASFMRDLILDKEGNVRPGINDSKYERVKWQVNYEDANTANDKSKSAAEKKTATDNLKDLYDDGVFEMQMTKIAYPARSVTININGPMKSLWPATKAEPENSATVEVTEKLPVGETQTATGAIVEGDSGTIVEAPTKEGILAGIPQKIKDTIKLIIDMSERVLLSDDNKYYTIAGELYSRVTSIKYALDGMGDRFDPNSPWALPSSLIGNSFDEFGRFVFNGAFDGLTDAGRMDEFGKFDNSTAKNYADAYMALKAFQSRLLEKGQVVIATGDRSNPGRISTYGMLDVTVRGEDGRFTTKKVRVAGTLDVLAIDRDGNLHIYDFKTTRSGIDKAKSEEKGYNRQLSMYAKFLEQQLADMGLDGIKVKSINIIPIKADYPAPNRVDYRQTRPGSDQLEVKEKSKKDFEQFTGANYQVQKEFALDRLSDEELTASFDKMTEDEKQAIVEALQDQSETPATEITKTDEIINSKPEIEESPATDEEEEGLSLKSKRFGLSRKKAATQPVDTSIEETTDKIDPENSLRARLKDLENACGGKKKS